MAYKDPLDPRNRQARLRHYYKNKEQYYARNRAKKEEFKQLLIEIKNKPCMDCGGKFPHYVMDFDHTKDDKLMDIGMLKNYFNKKRLLDEIAKCDLVCSNCHRIRTHNRHEAKKLLG